MSANYRYNQFTDNKNFVLQSGEIHIVPPSSPYTIRLSEVPDRDSGINLYIMDFLMAAITSSSATSITVAHGTWYTAGDVITIDSEQVTVSAITGNVLTVTRGTNSTVATTHINFSRIYIQNSMEEVAASPSGRQFWPDYSTSADSDSGWNTGTILFSEADAGKIVSIDYTKTGSLAAADAITNYPPWYYGRGDGSDGNFKPTVSTTLAGGVYNFSNVIIPAGVTITLTGCAEIKCLGVFICSGIITANGANGNSDTGSSATSQTGGKGCNGYMSNSGGNSNPSAVGDTGASGTGIGGAGGASGAAYTSTSIASAAGGSVENKPVGLSSSTALLNYVLSNKVFSYGAGGGGGANGGGSGAGGGGSVYVTAGSAYITGSITANGGNGGNGYVSDYPAQQTGGGGGGGGGAVVIVADIIINSGTLTVNGGTGGTQTNNSAYAGSSGSNGVVYLKELGAA